ncbi:MAG: HIT family protein [Nanoarchaeota archaeon]
MLSEKELGEARRQLKAQITHLPFEQRNEAESQIDDMSDEAISSMVEQQRGRNSVFRMIVDKEIDSVIIEENDLAIAVLEINPLSRGHMLVIPIDKVGEKKEMPEAIINFAGKLSERARVNLGAKRVLVRTEQKFGEIVLDLIPVYDGELDERSQRKKAEREELEQIKKEINTEVIKKAEPERIKAEKKKRARALKLKRRIP